ncbi:hypothetical protein JQK15_25440 [Sphingobium sp. BHU LFT2]|uniref:hypothetical protein n=1 Tax=Sphingobium sp. BHU LFT2 TaxID=2807634 RepID=UPI001BECE5BA|nr:hypothetical protein [Sphingobium sp. BHU LFT2]MBT2246853.1 hypothetical protein [Sphingobium sp. BHU LFT2]
MAHLSGTDRSQLLLLPEAVDDYVGPDNPVRFIEACVDGLDLAAAGFLRVAAKETGCPGFDPADILKLYTYRYFNRVRSSRWLKSQAHRDIEASWLHAASEAGLPHQPLCHGGRKDHVGELHHRFTKVEEPLKISARAGKSDRNGWAYATRGACGIDRRAQVGRGFPATLRASAAASCKAIE